MKRKHYLIISFFTFTMEIAILKFWSMNSFIRGTLGDIIAVIFLYTIIMGTVKISSRTAVLISIATAVILEFLQYLNFAQLIGMGDNKIFTTLFGSYFDWKDIAAYFIGTGVILICENRKNRYFI